MGIRRKLNVVIVSLLTVTAAGIAISTADIFLAEFTHFSHKSTLDAAGLLANRVQIQMKYLLNHVTTLVSAMLEDFRYPEDKIRFLEDNLKREPHFYGLTLYRRDGKQFLPAWRAIHPGSLQLSKEKFETLQRNFPLDLESISKGSVEFIVSQLDDKTPALRIGFPVVQDSTGNFTQIITVELKYEFLASLMTESTEFNAFLTDRNGVVLASNAPGYFLPGEDIRGTSLFGLTQDQKQSSQHTIVGKKGEIQISAFQRVGFADLAVLTQTPISRIEAAENQVYLRSIFLCSSLLFLALFISFRFSGAITNPIEALSEAADQIGMGNFSIRVRVPASESVLKSDETSKLSRSFNFMANRIGELMIETAQKARMEKELETAKALQRLFLPENGLSHSKISLQGHLQAATECGGDWWNYALIGDRLLVTMGDVTGHGVSAALLTAAAQGVFSIFLEKLKVDHAVGRIENSELWLKELSRQINIAILGAGHRQSGMTLTASVIDLSSGMITSTNFGNRVPFIFRKGEASTSDLYKSYLPIAKSHSVSLGDQPNPPCEIMTHQLQAGDLIIWYTDGLIECENSANETFGKKRLLKTLDHAINNEEVRVKHVCESLLNDVFDFLGNDQTNLSDDITVAVGVIPSNASFRCEKLVA